MKNALKKVVVLIMKHAYMKNQISDIDAFYNIPSWCRISDREKKEYYKRYLFIFFIKEKSMSVWILKSKLIS